MSKLFEDDSGSDIEIKTDNSYAKNYDTWRKKEEFNKIKARHGEDALELEDEDTSEDDEVGVELTEEVEKDFYKTLALLKKKDPKIYEEDAVFFKESNENDKTQTKSKKEKKMFLRDYERELLLTKGAVISDSENEEVLQNSNNFMSEDKKKLKESFKVQDDESDEDIGDLLRVRQPTKEEEGKKEEDFKAWLMGKEKKLKDKETASSLKPLREFWDDPKLGEDEKFLKDYLLNRRYLENGNKSIPTYNEIVQNLSEDEDEIQRQEEFEHAYNFRYEEPDQEFIKRYPRTIEGSLRREDNRRKIKRQEVKERKAREKEEKMEELRKLRDIKRKEVEEKIEKLREITGNKEIAFNDEDIEGDFDPEAHDKRMQALFNDEYYKDGQEEDTKPPIDLDDEDALELVPENYDNWAGPNEEDVEDDGPHCEDDSFNMDADYDPRATQKELIENSRKKKKRKRKSKFVEMLAEKRPKFNPLDENYEKYVDEYYKFDCEDIIDDIPFKFKYRKVVPNSFGLSVEEILLAKDRELNKWCSLKKAVSLRDEHVEKYEQIAYAKKGENIALKKKIIPSLFEEEESESKTKKRKNAKPDENNEEKVETVEEKNSTTDSVESPKKKKKRKNVDTEESVTVKEEDSRENGGEPPKKKKKVKKQKQSEPQSPEDVIPNENGNEASNNKERIANDSSNNTEVNPKKKKKNKKQNKDENKTKNEEETSKSEEVEKPKNKKKNHPGEDNKKSLGVKRKFSGSDQQKPGKKFKKGKKNSEDVDIGISDSRIACFGWNPKKFKNKLKYGNKNENK